MKLIMVHGIGQQDRKPEQLLAEWKQALLTGGLGSAKLESAHPEMAYYADILQKGLGGILEGLPERDRDKAEFIAEGMQELAGGLHDMLGQSLRGNAANVSFEDAFNRLVANPFEPMLYVRELLDQVYDYLTKPALRKRIDDEVMKSMRANPLTVIGHSLGSVVAYRLLRNEALPCRRFITLGSPLSFKTVRQRLDGPFAFPAGLADWHNFFDPLDLVALGKPFPPGNGWAKLPVHVPVDNDAALNHFVTGYLRRAPVVSALSEVL